MPNDRGLKGKKILKKAYESKLTIHPGNMKMYGRVDYDDWLQLMVSIRDGRFELYE